MTIMESRPKLEIQLKSFDYAIEALSLLILLGVWALVFINYSHLPETIPTHFNALGQPDRFSSKIQIIILPIVLTFMYAGLSMLNRYPHIFNYPNQITPENAYRQYESATRMIRMLNCAMCIVFGLIVFNTIRTAQGDTEGLGVWFLPATLILIFAPLIHYFFTKK